MNGTAALRSQKGEGLLDFTLFKCEDFCFSFVVSFVAGATIAAQSALDRPV